MTEPLAIPSFTELDRDPSFVALPHSGSIHARAEMGRQRQQQIFDCLANGPLTVAQLVAKTGIGITSVGYYLRRMMTAPRVVRVTGFAPRMVAGRRAVFYGQGSAPDAQPPVMTDDERDSLIDRNAVQRSVAKSIALATSRPHSWLSSLGL
jgi:hypothetical protein